MILVVSLCIILSSIAGAAAYLLFRRRMRIPLAIGALAFAGSLAWFLTPVCVAIPDEDLSGFKPPIDARTDTGMIGQPYFQQREGVWFHCKVRIVRQMFF